jgi:hypothetical protein
MLSKIYAQSDCHRLGSFLPLFSLPFGSRLGPAAHGYFCVMKYSAEELL